MSAVQNLNQGTRGAEAHSVFVSGSDVYVAGSENNAQYNAVAKVWKNGTLLYNLTNGTRHEQASSIFVSGNDVYVAGYDGYVATLWKNGIAQRLTDANNYTSAHSVFVSGNDVYVAGESMPLTSLEKQGSLSIVRNRGYATLWKNGIAQRLTTEVLGNDLKLDFTNLSVFVSGSNVYVAGTLMDERKSHKKTSILWTNGNAQKLRRW